MKTNDIGDEHELYVLWFAYVQFGRCMQTFVYVRVWYEIFVSFHILFLFLFFTFKFVLDTEEAEVMLVL